MKKFIIKVILFFICAIVIDFVANEVFSILRTHAKGGITQKNEYIANRCDDDIIIFGSSRAAHHYNPQLIEDALGLSCYNCGEKGNGVVLAYGRFKMLTKRHKPKLILFEVTPDFDYGINSDNRKYLSYLRPYYNTKELKSIFKDFDDDMSWLKMKSSMYQNTSKILHNIVDNIVTSDNHKGFLPLEGEISSNYEIIDSKDDPDIKVDSLKLSYVEKLVVEARQMEIPIIFIASPIYASDKYNNLGPVYDYKPAKEICDKYDIPFWVLFTEPTIINNPKYWHDGGHLNKNGAFAYTKLIIRRISDLSFTM